MGIYTNHSRLTKNEVGFPYTESCYNSFRKSNIFVHFLSCFASQFTKDIYLDKSSSTEKNIGSDVRVLNLIIIDFQHPKLAKIVSSCFASQLKPQVQLMWIEP